MCRPKSEAAEALKDSALRPEKTVEAEGHEQGMDELMHLAQSRHLTEEPQPPDAQGALAHQATPAEPGAPAKAAKDSEVGISACWSRTSMAGVLHVGAAPVEHLWL